MKEVAIIVVTYNRLVLLKEVINALRVQSYSECQIVVVNNGSTDGTEDWLRQQTDIVTITQNNSGGAGGFYTGMKYAVENGCDFCWIMDDDVITLPNALEELIKAYNIKKDIGFVCSQVVGIDGQAMNTPSIYNESKNGLYPNFCDLIEYQMIRVSSATFVSVLISCAVVKKVGLPCKEFFIWGDDSEYTYRISREFDCYMSCKSRVVHKRANQRMLSLEEEKDRKRIKNYYFQIRNNGYVIYKFGTMQEKFIYHLYVLKHFFRNILSAPYKSWIVLKGYVAFYFFNPRLRYPVYEK